jgi:hypothetical protein
MRPLVQGPPAGRDIDARRRRAATWIAGALMVALAAPAWAGHESPFYPSYYPQEIRLQAVPPAAAGRLLQQASIHAYVGADPFAGHNLPADTAVVESLGAYVVVTMNSAGRLADRATRCATAGDVIRSLARKPGFVFHPYPVTPYHRDYLFHADLVQAAVPDHGPVPRPGGEAPRGVAVIASDATAARLLGDGASRGPAWDARVETIDVDDLLGRHAIRFAGWVGPAWLKQGWYGAYLVMAGSVTDHQLRSEVDQEYRRLLASDYRSPEEQVNLERRLVSGLRRGCERLIAGYTVRRESFNTAYSPGIENVGFDSHSGFNAPVFIRTAKLKDFPWNGWLRIGVAGRPTAPWNPVGGFGDAFGRLMWAAVGDPALLAGPHNGGWIANRLGSWTTWGERVRQIIGSTPGSENVARPELGVPADAVVPQPGTGRLERVKPGTRALDMVEYRVLASSFHDGTPMTVADALYPMILAYRWGGGSPRDPRAYDPSVDRQTAPARRSLVAIKVIETQKVVKNLGGDLLLKYDVPVVRVFLNHAEMDPQRAAVVAMPWSTVPWHLLALMDQAAQRSIGALSPEAASSQRVEVLDLVRSARQRERLARLVDEFAASGYVPESLRGWATADEAKRRWRALRAFYRANGHFLVTNGPYRLAKWSPTEVVLTAFRDLSYPLGVGSFDKAVYARRAHLPALAARGGRVEFRPDVDRVVKYDRFYKIVREALASNASGAFDDITPVCRYVIIRSDGQVVKVGTAPNPKNGVYAVNLAEGLGAGVYTALVTVYLNDNYMTPDVKSVSFRR